MRPLTLLTVDAFNDSVNASKTAIKPGNQTSQIKYATIGSGNVVTNEIGTPTVGTHQLAIVERNRQNQISISNKEIRNEF